MVFASVEEYAQRRARVAAEMAARAAQRKAARKAALARPPKAEVRTRHKGFRVGASRVEAAFAFDAVQDARLLLDCPMPDKAAIRVELVEAARGLAASLGSGRARWGAVPSLDLCYKRKGPPRRVLAFDAVQGARREMSKEISCLEEVLAQVEEAACHLAVSFGYTPAKSGTIPHPYIRAELYYTENGRVMGRWRDELTSM